MKPLFFILIFVSLIYATPDWKYRKEYNKYQYKELVEKAIELTQKTNALHKENMRLMKAVNKPFKFFKLGFIAVCCCLILVFLIFLTGKIVLKIL